MLTTERAHEIVSARGRFSRPLIYQRDSLRKHTFTLSQTTGQTLVSSSGSSELIVGPCL